ncbi:MAG: alpha/beta hydrolase [Oscillospiraceae bacterium]|nr:alpha/beta hydrolase [Oscillospiraceae bacterium]
MEHKQIESENGVTHYWLEKSEDPAAPCIVFTHGLTADHTMFEKQIAYFSGAYSVLTWDVPLHGASRPYRDFTYERTALELHGILEREDIRRVLLVGMSMGGYPSQLFAAMFPASAAGLVALDTTPFGLRYYSKSDLWWLQQVEPMARCFPDHLLRESMARSVSATDYSCNKMKEMLAPLTKAQIIEQMGVAYGRFALENRDISLSCPILILLGDRDRTGKVKQYCARWAGAADCPLHLIKNAAHFSNGDNPEQVNREIESFARDVFS